MKKFYAKKEEPKKPIPLQKATDIFPLSRRHTLMEIGKEAIEEGNRRAAFRTKSIDSISQLKDSPPDVNGPNLSDKSSSFSTASTVVITESELSSSSLYKNMKAAVATPVKPDSNPQDPTNFQPTAPPYQPLADEPAFLGDPKIVTVPVPMKPRREKLFSRVCYAIAIIVLCLSSLGIITVVGSVIYAELFAGSIYNDEIDVADKPLMKSLDTPPFDSDEKKITMRSSPEMFQNMDTVKVIGDLDKDSVSSYDTNAQNKSAPPLQTFMGNISSKIASTLQSQGIIDQSSATLAKDLDYLTDRLIISAEETWNASQTLMSDIASLFRPNTVSSTTESTRISGEGDVRFETDLRQFRELPARMFQGFIGRPLGPFPNFNFVPQNVQQVNTVGPTQHETSPVEGNKENSSLSAEGLQTNISGTTLSKRTGFIEPSVQLQGKTDGFQDPTTSPILEHEIISFEMESTTVPKAPMLPDELKETDQIMLPEEVSPFEERNTEITAVGPTVILESVLNQMNLSGENSDSAFIDKSNPTDIPFSLTPTELNQIQSTVPLVETKTNSISVNATEENRLEMNEPVLTANVAPVEFLKRFQMGKESSTLEPPESSSKRTIDIKSSLAEAMKHLLVLDTNNKIPSSRSKSNPVKPKVPPLNEQKINPSMKPHVNETSTQKAIKSERMRYLQKLRTMMFGRN